MFSYATLAWWISCLPGWIAFLWVSRKPHRAQQRVLNQILERNQQAQWLRVSPLSLTDYNDYRDAIDRIRRGEQNVLTTEPVLLLQPTSGSTSGTKLIPYTASLQDEFGRAIDPWIWSLYRAWPKLLLGRHYWTISPTTPPATDGGTVPVGFADDATYLNPLQRIIARHLMVVPPDIRLVQDHDTWQYLTLLFLVRERNLRMISVWHPSFLTGLMKVLKTTLPALAEDVRRGAIRADICLSPELRSALGRTLRPDPSRAEELSRPVIWPLLQVISCWTDGWSSQAVAELKTFFPGVEIQGKGLLATEGVTTFPLGRTDQRVCAVRSHFLEFIDGDGRELGVEQLKTGQTYSVVLTTGGGLYRYRTHDSALVTGFFGRTPCLKFLSRDDFTCDLVGEKLHLDHVERALRDAQSKLNIRMPFAMLAPAPARDHYILFAQLPEPASLNAGQFGLMLDERLRENYHWDHARRIGQMGPIEVVELVGDAVALYRRHLIELGHRPGDIKLLALRRESNWRGVFSGM